MRPSIRPWLTVVVLAALTCLPAAALAQESPPMPGPTHQFRILLLRATPGETHIPDLPPDAVAALEDLHSVFVFRHFELIDAGWVNTDSAAQVHLGDAASYRVGLFLNTDLTFDDPAQLQLQAFEVRHSIVERNDAGRAFLSDPRLLLSTSFGIRVGETVVVGTSRTEAENEALVVLLQAVR